MARLLSSLNAGCNRGLYAVLKFLSQCAAFVLLDVRALGRERIPRRGGCLVAPNHQSFLDPWLVGQAIPRRAFYLARADLLQAPLLGGLLSRLNTLPVARGSVAARHSLELVGETLRAGEAVVMFPEGTRSPDGNLQSLKRGVARLARETLVPVVPVFVTGTYRVWPRHARVPRLGWGGLGRLRSREARDAGGIRISFGTPLVVESGEELEAFNERLRAAYLALAAEAGAPLHAFAAPCSSQEPPSEPKMETSSQDGERNGRSPVAFAGHSLPRPPSRRPASPASCATLW